MEKNIKATIGYFAKKIFVAILPAIIVLITLIVYKESNYTGAYAIIDSSTLNKLEVVSAELSGDKINVTVANGERYSVLNTAMALNELENQSITLKSYEGNDWVFLLGGIAAGVYFLGYIILSLIKALKMSALSMPSITLAPMSPEMMSKMKDGETKTPCPKDNSVKSNTKFTDVKGIDPIIDDLRRCVDSLKNPQKYVKMGVKPSKGAILYGPPGTGKTLVAKAVAGEAGVPLFAYNGADFVEKYIGVGASRIRELYTKARLVAPCIVFIDEIDAIGGQRSTNDNAGEDNRTINALLSELDGFSGNEGVLTICATNRFDMLDSALTRSGRFDLKLAVPLPDKKAREEILTLCSQGKKISPEVKLNAVAAKTCGFSGADLSTLINEAGLIAVARLSTMIENVDIEEAFFKVVMKGNKKKNTNEELRKVVAWHEAGHAVMVKLLAKEKVTGVTIVGSMSGAGGVTFHGREDEDMLRSRRDLINSVCVSYGGRAAEEILLGGDAITTGASADIKQATQIILGMVDALGMGNNGLLDVQQFNRTESFEEAQSLAAKYYKETFEFLKKNVVVLEAVATALLERESLDEEELNTVIASCNEPICC